VLGDYSLQVALLSLDLAETRVFYHDQLGLEIVSENDDAITLSATCRA
jgi:catechol-2,3-dioxygenase